MRCALCSSPAKTRTFENNVKMNLCDRCLKYVKDNNMTVGECEKFDVWPGSKFTPEEMKAQELQEN